MGFGFGAFGIMGVIVPIFFVVVIVIFIAGAVKGIGQWNKNNNSPRLTVSAEIVAKRTNVSHHHSAGEHHHHHTSTTYYVTFQVESGDRMEFHVHGHEYGMLIEGDRGNLTFQGTRYLGFERVTDFEDRFE